jgi:hypothetical protein
LGWRNRWRNRWPNRWRNGSRNPWCGGAASEALEAPAAFVELDRELRLPLLRRLELDQIAVGTVRTSRAECARAAAAENAPPFS